MTSFYIETFGKELHQADSEVMTALLLQSQFSEAANIDQADVIIINSCPINGKNLEELQQYLEELKLQYPYKNIILCGCTAQEHPEKFKKYALVGNGQISKIADAVEESLHNNKEHFLEREPYSLRWPKKRKNSEVEIIPIVRCTESCLQAIIKPHKQKLKSLPHEEIVSRVKQSVQEGVKEIILTGVDTYAYGGDIKSNLAILLPELAHIPGNFRIRIGNGNVKSILALGSLGGVFAEALGQDKIVKKLVIPLYSGSNKVLKELQIGFKKEEVLDLVEALRRRIPELNIETEIVLGCPAESEEDQWETINALKKMHPDTIIFSKFSPLDKRMAVIPEEIYLHRYQVLKDIAQNLSNIQNERWLDWTGEIFITEKVGERKFVGKNGSGKEVYVEGDLQLGTFVKVKITKTTAAQLVGKVV